LGIKARITLPLLRRKAAFACASFAFATFEDLAAAMRRAGMEGLDDEHFAIDAALSQGQIARQDAGAVLAMAKSVLATSPSLIAGLAQLFKMAVAGTRAMKASAFMLHVIVEGVSKTEVNAKLWRLRTVLAPGHEIPNTTPTVVRGMPFAPLFNVLGPKGERWVPIHGVLPHSKVAPFHDALTALYAERASDMRELGVWTGGMFETVNPSGFLYEVAIYWPGAVSEYHPTVLSADYLATMPAYPDDAKVNAFVQTLKDDITTLYGRFGATHFQLGKTYPYAAVLAPETLALLRAIKASLDPQGLMNPGALGLN
jgi:FAD/FMN-containing dehydrogenase